MCAVKPPMLKVLSNSSLSGFSGSQTVWEGGGLCSNFLLLPPPPPPPFRATLHIILADKCGETFDLVLFFYIKFCWKPATCFVARMLNVMFLHSCTIYILALLQTYLTYICCGTLLIYIGKHKIYSNFGYISTGNFFKDCFVVFDIYLRILIYPKLLEKNQVITC